MRVHLSPPNPLVPPKAILFDHDGTLVDSLGVVAAATNRVLRAHGQAERPAAELIAGMVWPTGERIGRLLGVIDPAGRQALAEEYYLCALELHELVEPYPGIVDLLAELAMRDVPMAVVSNNQTAFVKSALGHLGLGIRFEVIVGEEDMARPKPDPSGPLTAARHLGIEPGRCWFVGDSGPDQLAAHGAGMTAFGVTWGIHSRAEMTGIGFDRLIDTPADLLSLLEGR